MFYFYIYMHPKRNVLLTPFLLNTFKIVCMYEATAHTNLWSISRSWESILSWGYGTVNHYTHTYEFFTRRSQTVPLKQRIERRKDPQRCTIPNFPSMVLRKKPTPSWGEGGRKDKFKQCGIKCLPAWSWSKKKFIHLNLLLPDSFIH